MMNTNDAVSLDFWNGLAFYSGKSFPCGTIGCDVLNIPAEVIEKLKELCTVQYALINALTFGPGNPALLSAARESAQQIAKLLKDVKPFSYMDVPDVEGRIERIFSEAYLNNAIEYSTVFGGSTLDILSDPKYEQGKTLLRTLPVGILFGAISANHACLCGEAERSRIQANAPEHCHSLWGVLPED